MRAIHFSHKTGSSWPGVSSSPTSETWQCHVSTLRVLVHAKLRLPRAPLPLLKNCFRHHHVYTFVPVHQFRYIHVASRAGKHVGIIAAEMLVSDQKIDHLSNRDACGLAQIIVKSHGDV